MNSKRPINLDLATIKLPLPGFTSIIHRITGLILFVGVAFMLCALDSSLTSEQSFNELKESLQSPLAKFIAWGLVSALLYHFVAGVKHLVMDMGIGETLEGGKLGAQITIVVSTVVIILAGVWIW